MNEDVKKVMTIANIFNRESVDFYNEGDLLKQGEEVRTWVGIYDMFSWEEYEVQHIVPNLKVIGMCINSIPFFCRYEEHEKEYGTILGTYHYSAQKDKERYESMCPKCGWGVSAYLAIHCKYDEEFGVCHYDSKGNLTNQQTTFEEYLKLCRRVYYSIPDAKGKTNADRWRYYKVNGDVEAANRLEAEFLSQHRVAEEQNRNISGEVDRRFFGGQLASVVAAYLKYVGDVEAAAGGHQEAQEADRWVIDADVTLRVFRGDRAKAVAYLSEVVGHGYSATEYGKETKRLKIDIPFGYGKLFWKMICANDTSQTDKGYSTFNKGRS